MYFLCRITTFLGSAQFSLGRPVFIYLVNSYFIPFKVGNSMSNEDSSKCNIELEISLPDISTSSNASTSNVSEKDSSSEDVISEGSSLSPEFATSDCSLVEGNGFCEDSSLFEDLLQHGGSSDVVWCFKNFCPTLSRSVNYR